MERSATLSLLGFAVTLGCLGHEGNVRAVTQAPAAAPRVEPAAVGAASAEAAYGTVHFEVSCSPAAQEQFDVAVGELHSFFYPETVKAFAKVAEIDPTCAMAYWGIAKSQLPNPLVPPFQPEALRRGLEAIEKGKALGPRTQREADWLLALEEYFRDSDRLHHLVRVERYEQAMKRLSDRYPDDAEAAIFYALALLESASPHDKTYARPLEAAKVLERLAATHPNHPGIAHYVIHAYDYSPIAAKGLQAADAYARIAPAAPHAQHMPSHIYSMLGMWDASIESNLKTLSVARAYTAKSMPGVTHTNEPHSLDFLEYAYLQLGKDREARAVAAETAAVTKMNAVVLAGDTALAAVPVRFALERGAWAEAAAIEPRPSGFAYAEAVGYFGRALGAARLGDPVHLAQARRDVEKMVALRGAYLSKPDQAYWAEQTQILVLAASGWIARAEGMDAEAARLLGEAADLEDASEKHVAMENRLFPAREQLGYLLLDLGRADPALQAFEASLKSTPNRLRGFYGAARAAELAGYHATARAWYEKLETLTHDADGERPEISYARAFLAMGD